MISRHKDSNFWCGSSWKGKFALLKEGTIGGVIEEVPEEDEEDEEADGDGELYL